MPAQVRVIVADEHAIVRAGLRTLLDREDEMLVVAEAATADEAVQLCKRMSPDVLLFEPAIPGLPTTATIVSLRESSPMTRLVAVTAHTDVRLARHLLTAGLVGYVLKDDHLDAPLRAIRGVLAGGIWLSDRIQAALLGEVASISLTPREQDVLTLLATGQRNAEIAATLGIAVRTVEYHLTHMLAKLDARSRTEVVLLAQHMGLIPADESAILPPVDH
jgi:DNA-binding NarL/FixJ family response regulator